MAGVSDIAIIFSVQGAGAREEASKQVAGRLVSLKIEGGSYLRRVQAPGGCLQEGVGELDLFWGRSSHQAFCPLQDTEL